MTNLAPDPTAPVILDPFHPAVFRDQYLPKEVAGGTAPAAKLVNAWRSTLGDSDADTWLDEIDNCALKANDQTDTDHDAIGDPCDPTPLGTPPAIVISGDTPVNATGPGGAIVTYTATATDDIDANPTVNCTPATGTLFPIGGTVIACSSTDSLGNTSSATLPVTVLGAKDQLVNLTREVVESTGLPAAVKAHLIALVAGLDPSRPVQRLVTCLALRAFAAFVPSAEWRADANRIRAVIPCCAEPGRTGGAIHPAPPVRFVHGPDEPSG